MTIQKKQWVSWEELIGIIGDWTPAIGVDIGSVGGLTPGSIPFANASGFLTEDNAALFWDAAEKNLGIGTNVFGADMEYGIQIATGEYPTANVADTFAFYSKDFAADNACPHFRTEDGTVIGLNQSLFTTDNIVFAGLIITGVFSEDHTINYNLFLGYTAGDSIEAGGQYNVLIGQQAGYSLTTGDYNVAIGVGASQYNETGVGNVAIGRWALKGASGSSHDDNVALGYQSGLDMTTGYGNVLIGKLAGANLTTGNKNVCLGRTAGQIMTTSTGNLFLGDRAGELCTGINNVYIGVNAGRTPGNRSSCIFIGSSCGEQATTPVASIGIGASTFFSLTSGNYSVAIGYRTSNRITTGAYNVAIGKEADFYNQTGINNTIIGYQAARGVSGNSHSSNTLIGFEVAKLITTGGDNVCIGENAGYSLTTGAGNVVIGHDCAKTQLTTGNNQLWIANSDTATPLIYGEFDNALLLINGTLSVLHTTIADDGRGLATIHTLSANPAKSDGIGFYSEGHIGAITTDGPTYGAGIWLNIDPGATLGADVRALDIGIYEAGATCAGVNAYGLAIHMEFDDTDPPAGIYAFRINCNDTPGHATPAALIFAPNKKAIGLITGDPGTPDDAYLKIVMQGGDVYRIPLVKE